jgi:hypothetical protein
MGMNGPGTINNFTVFIVFQYGSSIPGNQPILLNTESWIDKSITISNYPSTQFDYGFNNAGTGISFTPSNTPSTNTTYVWTIVDAGSYATMYINGSSIGTSTAFSAYTGRGFGKLSLGGWKGSGRTSNGSFGEVQIYSSALNNTDRSAVENYLMYKWGLTGTAYTYPTPVTPLNTPQPWTIECWFYPTTVGITNAVIGNSNNGSANILNISVNSSNAVMFQVSSNSSTFDLLNVSSSNGSVSVNTWYHVAIVYDNSVYYAFLNGTQVGTSTSSTRIFSTAFNNGYLQVGKFQSNTFTGYIDEFRLSNNARYTSGFTPSASAFTTDANTVSLQHFDAIIGTGSYSPRAITDSASSPPTWTAVTSPIISSTSKFGTGSALVSNNSGYTITTSLLPYTLATINTSSPSNFPSGLSVWLDASDASSVTRSGSNVTQWNDKSGNSNNFLPSSGGTTVPTYTASGINNLGSVVLSGASNKYFSGTGPGSISQYSLFFVTKQASIVSDFICFVTEGTFQDKSVLLGVSATSQFLHIVNNSGSNINIPFTTTFTPTVSTTYLFEIIDFGPYVTMYCNGLLVCISSSNSVLSSKNLSSIGIGGWSSNVNRTMNGQIGEVQIYNRPLTGTDRTNVEQYLMGKWGIVSGTASGGSNPWTVECWFNPQISSQTNPIISNYYNIAATTGANIINISVTSNNTITFQASSNGFQWDLINVTSTATVIVGNWYHVAMVFDGTKYYAFLNGALVGSITNSNYINVNAFINYLSLGSFQASQFTGYIDEFRLSKSARYTVAFTPSNSVFSSDSNTISLQHFDTLALPDQSFTPTLTAFTSDSFTTYLNHFELTQDLNTTEQTLSSSSSQTLMYRSLAANTIYYLYAYNAGTPYYILSPRCYVKTGIAPTSAAGNSTRFRQLPYVFITDGSKNLYQIQWDQNHANLINPPAYNTNNNSSQDWKNSSAYISSIDLSTIVPKTSRLAIVNLRNTNAVNTTVVLRDTLYAGYGYIQAYSSSGTNSLEQTFYTPVDASQIMYMEKNTAATNIEYQIAGFVINDMQS